MQIEIVSVNTEDKGKYQMATVAYRSNGKLSEKKLMSFGAGVAAYKRLTAAQPGQNFTVTTVKNDKGFWDWTDAVEGTAEQRPQATTGTTPAPRNTYETPEERAIKQKYIVRQSSITNAIALFELDKKKVPTVQDVVHTAKAFENYVFGITLLEPSGPMEGLTQMEDDVPL